MKSPLLANLTLKDIEAMKITTAVLPMGATEPHNYHLPYGTDNILCGHISEGAAAYANARGGRCICLPALPFGYDGNMKGFPLAINLQPTTIIEIVYDIALSLAECGVEFLFLLNGHGGNELKTIIRELNRDVDLFISGANWWESVADVRARLCKEDGDHADIQETAGLLHIVPELVRMKQATPGTMNEPQIPEMKESWVKFSRPWKAFAPSSGAGDPRNATAEAGKELIETAIERIGTYLLSLSTSKREEGFPYARPPRKKSSDRAAGRNGAGHKHRTKTQKKN